MIWLRIYIFFRSISKFFKKTYKKIVRWLQTKFTCYFKGHEYEIEYEYQERYVRKKHNSMSELRYDIFKFQKCERCGKVIHKHKVENALQLGTFRNRFLDLTGYDFYIKKYVTI